MPSIISSEKPIVQASLISVSSTCTWSNAPARKSTSHSLKQGAWAALANLFETATVVGADHSDAYKVLKQKVAHGDYEDNLVVAAALRSGADFLVTDDEKLRRDAPIMALTVKEACEYLGLR